MNGDPDEEEFNKWLKDAKNRFELKGESTHFLRSIGIGDMELIHGGWHSKDRKDVEKLVAEHIPVEWSTDTFGIVEAGYNQKAGKFVGVHYFHKNIIANPQFDNLKDCIDWYMQKVQEMQDED